MGICLAIAASLIGLSIVIRLVRFALALVLVGLLFEVLTGHGANTVAQLTRLL